MSNATQKQNSEKTKSVRNRTLAVLLICILFLGVAVIMHRDGLGITVGSRKQVYHIELAQTDDEQEKGLGSRATLAKDDAMLFVFKKPQVVCIWMKDMKFPLDIVWLNSAKLVVAYEQNVQPKSYPKMFCPQVPTSYVLELNAGEIKKSGIHMDQSVRFSIPK